jgi:hypothetical protein
MEDVITFASIYRAAICAPIVRPELFPMGMMVAAIFDVPISMNVRVSMADVIPL